MQLQVKDYGFEDTSQRFRRPLPQLEPVKELAYVIVYFDTMAEKQLWKTALYRKEDAEECARGLGLMGKHIYNIVEVELK